MITLLVVPSGGYSGAGRCTGAAGDGVAAGGLKFLHLTPGTGHPARQGQGKESFVMQWF